MARLKYVPVAQRDAYLQGKQYASISCTGSLHGMKKRYGWDKAKEIFKSGNYYYAVWN